MFFSFSVSPAAFSFAFQPAKEMTLYLCWDSESETSKDRTIMDDSYKNCDDEAPKKRKKSSSSEVESDDSDSDSDEARGVVSLVWCSSSHSPKCSHFWCLVSKARRLPGKVGFRVKEP